MRFALTLTPIHDDTPDGVDIEVAITESTGEVYLTDGTPVTLTPAGAVVFTRDALTAFLAAAANGIDYVEDLDHTPDEHELVATAIRTLEAEASHA